MHKLLAFLFVVFLLGGGQAHAAITRDSGATAAGSTTATATITASAGTKLFLFARITGTNTPVISGTNGLTWTLRASATQSGSTTVKLYEWVADNPSGLSSATIIVTTASASATALNVIALAGISSYTLAPAPTTNNTGVACDNPAPGVDGVILASARFNGTLTPTAGSGWTASLSANNLLVEYLIATSGLSTSSVKFSNSDAQVAICDAMYVPIQASSVFVLKQNAYVISNQLPAANEGLTKLNAYVINNGLVSGAAGITKVNAYVIFQEVQSDILFQSFP